MTTRILKVIEFFYTTERPHAWTSGPSVVTSDKDNHYLPIESLERARELAKREENLTGGEDRVEVSWGSREVYREDVDYWGKPRDPEDLLLDRLGFPIPDGEVPYA